MILVEIGLSNCKSFKYLLGKILNYGNNLCTIFSSGRLGESVLLQALKCGGLHWRRSPGKAGEAKRPGEALPKGFKSVGGEDGSSLSGLICGKGNIAEAHLVFDTKYFLFDKFNSIN